MRRALVVGIDHYDNANDLRGCRADAEAVAALLQRDHDGALNFEVQTMLSAADAPVTSGELLAQIERLLDPPADAALLFFAGHGTENRLGGYLVTSDAAAYREGVKMTDILRIAKDSPVREVVIILDCCQAGAFGTPPLDDAGALLSEGLSVLTATRSTEAAVERDGRGLFSGLLCAALEGGAADTLGKVTVASIYAYVEEAFGAWDQRPQLKAHVSQLLVIRRAQESVAVDDLRGLVDWFDTVDAVLPLGRQHEPTEEPRDPDAERIFARLQKMRSAKLIEPVGEEHMYYAALNETGCRLTRLGRLYWQLITDDKL